jgi:predicted nucleic acid-binding protein
MQSNLKQKAIVLIETKRMNDKIFFDTNLLFYLYSEDMQHGQLIENRLKIFNPFLQL